VSAMLGGFQVLWADRHAVVQFIKQLIKALSEVARQSGGSISIIAQLEDSNYIQLLARGLEIPPSLDTFWGFSPSVQPVEFASAAGAADLASVLHHSSLVEWDLPITVSSTQLTREPDFLVRFRACHHISPKSCKKGSFALLSPIPPAKLTALAPDAYT